MHAGTQKFNEAVGVLLLGQPFFGQLLLKLKHVPDESVPTLCVSPTHIRFNPEFIDRLTLDEVVFACAHEVMHPAWMHLTFLKDYMASGLGPDGKVLDLDRLNRAMDYPMNFMLERERIGAVPRKEVIEICLDPRYHDGLTPQEIYCMLAEDEAKDRSASGRGHAPGPQALDGHEPGAPGDAEPGTSAMPITPADVIAAAAAHKAVRGTLPAGIERLLGEVRRLGGSPWKRLRTLVTTLLPGRDATSWRRLQRRYAVRGIGMPGPTSVGAGVIGVVADTSGSIGQEMLDLFGSHMAAIIDDARPREVRIYWTDARVNQTDVVRNGSQLRNVLSKPIKGGGGTDMRVGVKAAVTDKCDAIVVLTDGYTPFCTAPKPVIWAITTAGTASPYGHTINI